MEYMRNIKEDDTRFVDIAKSYKRFVDIIHFTESISTRMHGLWSENEIFSAVKNAFAESEDYSTVILKLDKDLSVLRVVAASLPDKKMKAAEKVGKFRMENFSIKLGKSNILDRVITGQETVHFNVKELVAELFPRTLVNLIWKAAGMQNKYSVVTPIKKNEKVIGAFSMTCPEFAQEFIPTAINLAQHISYALELAGEHEERRKAEEALKESESSLWLAQHLARVGHWEWNLRDDVFNMSDHMRFIYGLNDEVFHTIEDLVEKLIHPDDRKFVNSAVKKTAKDGFGKPVTYRIIRPDGKIRWIAATSPEIRTFDDKGEPQVMFGVIQDITERKKAEEERVILEEQLRQSEKLRAIGELAGGVAHDFNNMLGAITGYADLIAEENRDKHGKNKDAVLGKRIATITKASYRAADLIKKLLAFSRRGKYRNAPMDMHEIINDVLALLQGSIDRKITIRKKLTATCPVIKGDPSQIQNAVLNLAINACDAMKGGGVLLLSTRNEYLKKDQCCNEMNAGNYLVVSVSDTGKGMDDTTMSRIFEPFFTTKTIGEGTGLGLASVYGTLESHKGCITVESKIGVGSRFKLYIPVSEHEGTITKTENYSYMERGQGTILLVDDEEMVRSMVSDSLIRCGYSVYTCCDGSEAVEWYKEYHSNTDLVILDMIMPVMDGIECYENMKRINPAIKAILASGFSISNRVRKLIEKGSLEFIEKPFSRIDLSRLVAKLLKSENNGIKKRERVTS